MKRGAFKLEIYSQTSPNKKIRHFQSIFLTDKPCYTWKFILSMAPFHYGYNQLKTGHYTIINKEPIQLHSSCS